MISLASEESDDFNLDNLKIHCRECGRELERNVEKCPTCSVVDLYFRKGSKNSILKDSKLV